MAEAEQSTISNQKQVRLCSVGGCGRKHHAKGYCNRHAEQVRSTGSADYKQPQGTPIERLRRRTQVDPITGCWLWQGSNAANGYCNIGVGDKRLESIHRFSYRFHRGEIPDGLEVCHRCDIRHCWNPDHLFLGTHRENMEDAANKGRMKGVRGARRKLLSQSEIASIQSLPTTVSNKELARGYGVSDATIWLIRTRKGPYRAT